VQREQFEQEKQEAVEKASQEKTHRVEKLSNALNEMEE